MAIGLILQLGSDTIEVRIIETSIYFRTAQSQVFSTIDGLSLSRSGVIKEHPDLAESGDWRKIAIDRFKEKVKNMKSEQERTQYVLEELTKLGYRPMYLQKAGFRPIKLFK